MKILVSDLPGRAVISTGKQDMKLFQPLVIVLLCTGINAAAQDTTNKKNVDYPGYEQGIASYYADKFEGRKMANGKIYDHRNLTAAANRFSLGTWVKVSNLSNKKTVIVQITDRMHPKNTRLIDVSKAAAQELGFIKKGLTRVRVEVVNNPHLISKQ